jgi:hypothetical protein
MSNCVIGYFGLCPVCRKDGGYLNIGSVQWFFCKEHQKRWLVGANLFEDWKTQTEGEQRAFCFDIDFDHFEEVEAYYPPLFITVALNWNGAVCEHTMRLSELSDSLIETLLTYSRGAKLDEIDALRAQLADNQRQRTEDRQFD